MDHEKGIVAIGDLDPWSTNDGGQGGSGAAGVGGRWVGSTAGFALYRSDCGEIIPGGVREDAGGFGTNDVATHTRGATIPG